ncbi:MAG: hypothetical protein L0Y56_19100 [Nitrospira sp.]|nr:hypothetical protein [Nitrospira sp.]
MKTSRLDQILRRSLATEEGGSPMSTIEQLGQLRDELKAKQDKLLKRIEQIEHELCSVETTLGLLRPAGTTESGITPEEIVDLKPIDALVVVAQRDGGRLKSTQARSLLVEAGVIKGQNASSIIYNTIERSERFQKIKRGEYRLAGPKQASVDLGSDEKKTR